MSEGEESTCGGKSTYEGKGTCQCETFVEMSVAV